MEKTLKTIGRPLSHQEGPGATQNKGWLSLVMELKNVLIGVKT